MSRQLQDKSAVSTRQLCHRLQLPYQSLQRWRKRARQGRPLLQKPGPKKVGALPLVQLQEEIAALPHRIKRTPGSGRLHARYRQQISRRAYRKMIAAERRAKTQRHRHRMIRVTWKEPNLAWAIDATEIGRDEMGRKLHLIVVKDLASRHLFEPLVTLQPSGEEVACYLEKLFLLHGPPLVLKRDNGSIFICQEVDAILGEHCVIPLNSPAYYPPYNGGIEKGIRELKESLAGCLPPTTPAWEIEGLTALVRAVTHLCNTRPRRGLSGRSAAETYHHQPRTHFGRRARHTIFEWIRTHAKATMSHMPKADRRCVRAAWRHAVETWLRCQGLISLSTDNQVLPH